MKATIYADKDKVALADFPDPQVTAGKFKIKIAYCAICATDVHIVTQGLYGLPKGFPLGHEGSGVIIEAGEGTENSGLKVGDRVVINGVTFCGKCENCKKGYVAYCQNSMETFSGGLMSEYCVASPGQLYKIPDTISLAAAALTEPLVSATRGMDITKIKMGQTVAISGTGGIGTILLQLILRQGGVKVTTIEPVEAKRKLAMELGAEHAIDPFNEDIVQRAMEITNGAGFDYVFEASGVPAAAPPCLKIIGLYGTVIYFAVFPMDYELPVNLYELYSKEARILTVFTSQFIFPRAIDILGKLDLDKIIGAIIPLEEAVEAFELFHKSIHPKILIQCNEIKEVL